VTIGGDDTAFSASSIARTSGGEVRVAHVPKTIDNDLPLPAGMPTFGYESARYVGTELVLTIMEDSRTTNRWFLVVVMGRKAGHLALGIGKAAGATLTIIPEEFSQPRISLDDVSKVIEGSILKRRLTGQSYGVAVVAEGIGERIAPEELVQASGIDVSYDPYGHITLADVPIAGLIKQRVQRRFAERDDKLHLTDVTLGYELRCTQPIPFDIDYTRTLGNGAVRFLLSPMENERLRNGGFVTLEDWHINVLPFDEIVDPETGRTRVRLVDVRSEYYRVARDYMIRLDRRNLEDETMLARLAEVSHLSREQLREEFGSIADYERAFA
jgi:6-phosphofructokinase 1